MRDILALQMTDGPGTTASEEDLPCVSVFSVNCDIEEQPI
jgi:hypothetical protein